MYTINRKSQKIVHTIYIRTKKNGSESALPEPTQRLLTNAEDGLFYLYVIYCFMSSFIKLEREVEDICF